MKKILGIILSVFLVLSLTMQVAAIKSVPVKSVTLDKTNITIEVGKTYNLKATLSPANTTQRLLSFATGNKNIATVDKKGKVTAVGAGKTTISVLTANKKVYAKCTITVTAPKPYEFSIFRTFWLTLNEDTDPVIQYLNKKFNIKIHIWTAPYETWQAKYNIYVSSGKMPDVSITTGPGTINFNEWCEHGFYMDITNLYKQYCPNIQKYVSDDIINAHKINGKLYGIPRPSLSDTTNAIRQDWLDKLNLPMPKTLDELTATVKAFKEKDPDGNGKADTYAYTSEDSLNVLQIIFGAFGIAMTPITTDGSINWIPDGKGGLQAPIMAPAMKDAIKYISNLYKTGLLDPDWKIIKSLAHRDNRTYTGKVGFMASSFMQMMSEQESKIKANDPKVKLVNLEGVTGPGGIKYQRPMQKGFYMVSSLSRKVKNPKKILEFLDYLMTPEGDELIRYGIEGLTYKKEGGVYLPIQDAVKNYGYEMGHPFRQILQPPTIAIAGEDPRIPELKEKAKILFDGPFLPAPTIQLPSIKTVTAKQGSSFIQVEITKIIVEGGDIDKKWNDFINEWRSTGGDKLTKEANAIYARNK